VYLVHHKYERRFACNVTIRRVRVTIVAVEKQQILQILNVCVVALCPRMKFVCYVLRILSFVTTTLPALYHKRQDFRGKVTERKICVLVFPTTSV
jgi:hypothetical protein